MKSINQGTRRKINMKQEGRILLSSSKDLETFRDEENANSEVLEL